MHGRPAHAPAQVPAGLRTFTGRRREVAALLDHAARADGPAPAATVIVVHGMPGVGKTTLALHVAHQVAADYSDGQLFVDLHGHTSGVPPAEPSDVLARMLRTLGVPGPEIPGHPDDRAALYRSRPADRRVIIVLDNAVTGAQVRPLLPGAPGCLVLVTSRRRLFGLDDAHHLELGVMDQADALRMLDPADGRRTPRTPTRWSDWPNCAGDFH